MFRRDDLRPFALVPLLLNDCHPERRFRLCLTYRWPPAGAL